MGRRIFNRLEWMRRLQNLPLCTSSPTSKGLVLIQIDGLSRHHLEKALRDRNMPFLKKLIKKKNFRLWPLYSGVPSLTPSVQGELFYGVRQCTPSFQFWDRRQNKKFTMYSETSASEIEKSLAEKGGEPLLKEGSSYGNIFAGGAGDGHSHLCAVNATWRYLIQGFNPYPIFLFFLLFPLSIFRAVGLVLLEIILAVFDAVRGALRGYSILLELQFILTRLSVSVLMREMITSNVKMDIHRALPVIHVNLFGYDEQAHRRGPSSRFAFWSLMGIDDAIKRIYHTAKNSDQRNYEVWIYSDHGQEDVMPYPRSTGKTLKQSLQEIYAEFLKEEVFEVDEILRGCVAGNERCKIEKVLNHVEKEKTRLVVTAMGPIGHIYFPRPLGAEEKNKMAAMIAAQGKVPLVLNPDDAEDLKCWTPAGSFQLPEDWKQIMGSDHPYAEHVLSDLKELCHHSFRGDLILLGWSKGNPSISFPDEHGAHGGIASRETEGFVLVPDPIRPAQKPFFRPMDLRQASLKWLEKIAYASFVLNLIEKMMA